MLQEDQAFFCDRPFKVLEICKKIACESFRDQRLTPSSVPEPGLDFMIAE